MFKSVKVYLLIDPRNYTPFYVGLTSGRLDYRLNNHLMYLSERESAEICTLKKNRLIKDILKSGNTVIILEIATVMESDAAYYEEFFYNRLTQMGYELHQSVKRFKRWVFKGEKKYFKIYPNCFG